METHNHAVLKVKALEWLYLNAKCQYVTTELKIGRYIFDVVGCDGSRVFIIEAKQDINDYIRDLNNPNEIKENILLLKKEFLIDNNKEKYVDNVKKEREKSIKFLDDSLLKLSSHRYLITPDGMLTEENTPQGWGLLNEEPRVIKKCDGNRIDKKIAEKIIRDICVRNTKIYLEMKEGVEFGKQVTFPDLMLL